MTSHNQSIWSKQTSRPAASLRTGGNGQTFVTQIEDMTLQCAFVFWNCLYAI